jgi:hypothetical protein
VACVSARSQIRALPRSSCVRWLQRPRAKELVGGVDLDSMSECELERLYAGLLRLAALPDEEVQALIRHLLTDRQDA